MYKASKFPLTIRIRDAGGATDTHLDAYIKVNGARIEHEYGVSTRQLTILASVSEQLEQAIAAVELGAELRVRLISYYNGTEEDSDNCYHPAILTSATDFGEHFILQVDLIVDRPPFFSRIFNRPAKGPSVPQ